MKGWRDNPGSRPPIAKGKRVVVELANGTIAGRESVNGTSPPGWAADQARWTITGSPFDIRRFMIL